MRRITTLEPVLGCALACLVLASIDANAQTAPQTQQQREQLQRLIYSVKGSDLFRAHCDPCHGADAEGRGPLASVLKARVPDLTVLAKNNNGEFPAVLVRKIIIGEDASVSHGSREMPIWGPIFHHIESDQPSRSVRNMTKKRDRRALHMIVWLAGQSERF
jgi:hypothetical protein